MKNLKTFEQFVNEGYFDEELETKTLAFTWFEHIFGKESSKPGWLGFEQDEFDEGKFTKKYKDIKIAKDALENSSDEYWNNAGFDEVMRIALAASAEGTNHHSYVDVYGSHWTDGLERFTGNKMRNDRELSGYRKNKTSKDFLSDLKNLEMEFQYAKDMENDMDPAGGYGLQSHI